MRERFCPVTLPDQLIMDSAHNPNRSLIRIFCLSLCGLLLLYSMLSIHSVFQPDICGIEMAIGVLRVVLGLLALGALFRWGWVAESLQRHVTLMSTAFEADYASLSTKTKIRLIVLVTMLSLLLELVLIR